MKKHNDIFGEHADDEVVGNRVLSFRDEMRQMPRMLRATIWGCLGFFVLLCFQCVLIMPVILYNYGWGYGGAYIH
jgi:hypothetical protein